jgi:hypothetical protein
MEHSDLLRGKPIKIIIHMIYCVRELVNIAHKTHFLNAENKYKIGWLAIHIKTA